MLRNALYMTKDPTNSLYCLSFFLIVSLRHFLPLLSLSVSAFISISGSIAFWENSFFSTCWVWQSVSYFEADGDKLIKLASNGASSVSLYACWTFTFGNVKNSRPYLTKIFSLVRIGFKTWIRTTKVSKLENLYSQLGSQSELLNLTGPSIKNNCEASLILRIIERSRASFAISRRKTFRIIGENSFTFQCCCPYIHKYVSTVVFLINFELTTEFFRGIRQHFVRVFPQNFIFHALTAFWLKATSNLSWSTTCFNEFLYNSCITLS